MEYKFKVGDQLRNTIGNSKGTVKSLTSFDNKPAYIMKNTTSNISDVWHEDVCEKWIVSDLFKLLPNMVYRCIESNSNSFDEGYLYTTNSESKIINKRGDELTSDGLESKFTLQNEEWEDSWEQPKEEKVTFQFIIESHIIGKDTQSDYYKHLKAIMNNDRNNIFGRWCYYDGDKFSIKDHKVDEVYIISIPKSLKEFKEKVSFFLNNKPKEPPKENKYPESGPEEWWDERDEPELKPEPQEDKVELQDLEIKEEIKLMMPFPILLEGPVGSGKSTILQELAKELNLDYYASVLTDQTSKNEFTGYKNVMNGKYVSPEFRKAAEFGGMYVLEEINATTSNTTIIFNTIANGYFVFADKNIDIHPDFLLCATMNTITNAKDFGGRRVLDKSVRDRFHKIMVLGDTLRFDSKTVIYKDAIDEILRKNGITDMVTHRDCQRFEHMVSKGIQLEVCIEKCLLNEKIALTNEELIKITKEGPSWK